MREVPTCRSTARCARSILRPVERKWEFKYLNPSPIGLLTTASNLIFSGDNEGNLLALDSRNGKLLWRYQMGCDDARNLADHLHARTGASTFWCQPGRPLTAWALPN